MTYQEFLVLVGREIRGRDWQDHISADRKRDIAYSSVLAVGANADISRLIPTDVSLSLIDIDGFYDMKKAELPDDLFHYRQDNGIIYFTFYDDIIKYPHLHNRSFQSLRLLDGNRFYCDEPFMSMDSQGRDLYVINSTTASLRYSALFTEPTGANESTLEVPLVSGDIQQAIQVMSVYLKSIDIRDAGEAGVQSMVAQMIGVQTGQRDG